MDRALLVPYTHVPNLRGENILRPLLPVTLSHEGKSIEATGLIDSGSDISILPYSIGQRLGLIWDERRALIGLSGNLRQTPAQGVGLMAQVGDFQSVMLMFAWIEAENAPLIFGQISFFMKFDVCFHRSAEVFDIRNRS